MVKVAIQITSIKKLHKKLFLLCILKFSTLNKGANVLVIKLANSDQAVKKNDNNFTCHIPLRAYNSNGGNDLICLRACNNNNGSNLICLKAGNNNSIFNLTSR